MWKYDRYDDPNQQYMTPNTVATNRRAANDLPPDRTEILIAQAKALEAFDAATDQGEREKARHDLLVSLDDLKRNVGIEASTIRADERTRERQIESGVLPSPAAGMNSADEPTTEQLRHVANNQLAMLKDRLSKVTVTNAKQKPLCPKCNKRH